MTLQISLFFKITRWSNLGAGPISATLPNIFLLCILLHIGRTVEKCNEEKGISGTTNETCFRVSQILRPTNRVLLMLHM
jgi:hypothetical protein